MIWGMERLNILIVTADDLGGEVPGCFGGHPEVTPNLDRLAAEGMRFERAHVNVAVCAPSRSILMSGKYGHRCGATGFDGIDDDCPILPEILREAGYLTGAIDKIGHTAKKSYGYWDWLSETSPETGHGRAPTLFGRRCREFLGKAKEEGRPFFLLVNSRDPHRPFSGSRQEQKYLPKQFAKVRELIEEPSRRFRPEEVKVPGFLPDIEVVREEYADYHSSARRLDDTIGQALAALEDFGYRDNTIAIFVSDHGMPFPFAKFNCYPFSTKTPLVVRWPGKVRAGAVEAERFVAGIDLLPTLLDAVEIDAPEDLDGRSFLGLLEGGGMGGSDHRVAAFHLNQQQERLEMRSWMDGDYIYIYNAWAGNGEPFQDETGKGYVLDAMIREGQKDGEVAKRVVMFQFRCPQELYDLRKDPNCLDNLADDAGHASVLRDRQRKLLSWMRGYDDELEGKFADFLENGAPYVDPQNESGLVKRCRVRY